MAADKNMLEGITTAKQSSVGWGGYAAKALDGDHSGNYGDGHCTHTSRFSLLPLMEYLFVSLWWVPACTAYSQKKKKKKGVCGMRHFDQKMFNIFHNT